MKVLTGMTALAAMLVANPVLAGDATRTQAGTLADGTAVEAVTLSNDNGVSATIITYGATLQDFMAPDRDGNVSSITLGYDDVSKYQSLPNYFGVTVGRYANRIAGATFSLDGKTYKLPPNDNPNSLHGGMVGFDKRIWTIASVEGGDVPKVVMTLRSADGDQGYPGNLDVSVTYTLDDAGNLGILFEATPDAPTVVNMTNHAIFNLAGTEASRGAMGHYLMIPAKAYTPVDQYLIPTGELRPVAGTVFDFTNWRRVEDGLRDGSDEQIVLGRGYDHNFALDKGVTATPGLAAYLVDMESGRSLEVLTTEPGVQFYTGNFLDGTVTGRGDKVYRMGDGIALEPQKFPDSPNQPGFVSARVNKGETYRHQMIYRVGVVD